jgi:hypothetical protein
MIQRNVHQHRIEPILWAVGRDSGTARVFSNPHESFYALVDAACLHNDYHLPKVCILDFGPSIIASKSFLSKSSPLSDIVTMLHIDCSALLKNYHH